jgi:hypothetical protein
LFFIFSRAERRNPITPIIPEGMVRLGRFISLVECLMYHQLQMRRSLSILLVILFSLGPLAATLQASDEDARLPACCRRNGAHHCAMSMEKAASMAAAASGGATVRARSTCPLYPGDNAATASAPQALAARAVTLPDLLAHPHSPAAAHAAARLSQIRTRSSRAPPQNSLA